MFQKFKDRVTSALSGDEAKVQTLQSMGFDQAQARNALQTTGGDVDRAAELLLASHMPTDNAPTHNHDDEMQRAMQASLQAEEDRRMRTAQAASVGTKPPARTAATNRAGEAAARRAAQSQNKFGTGGTRKPKTTTTTKPKAANKMPPASTSVRRTSGGLTAHHPGVKVPAKLQDKTKEEQVVRCADRLKSHPQAVDTLYRALVAVRDHPSNDKYRKIDKTSAGYKRTLENAPGAEGLLLAMNFHVRGHHLVLERHLVDPALLYLGISALDGVKERDEYKMGKRKLEFAKEIKVIQASSDSSEAEALQRAAYMAKCPSEPTGGRGALMQVLIADETVRRRFDGDDVLQDVINWIGGHGSVIPEKLLTREWCLVDLNRYPVAPIDCASNLDKTLQYVGFWPSGRLEILPSSDSWKLGGGGSVQMGSARGLGAAPTEVLR